VDRLLRALSPGESPAPLLSTLFAESIASEGFEGFRQRCREVRDLASNLWDLPNLRFHVLAVVLDAELRLPGACTTAEAKRLCMHFEEILSAASGSVEWWLRYAAFAQRAASWDGVSGVPQLSDLHSRAMRAVSDQGAYQEKAQYLLQGVGA